MKPGRSVVYGLLLGALVACGKTDPPPPPPPPPKVEAPKAAVPDANAEIKRLASEVYVYAYPMVVTDVTRQVNALSAPLNTFAHRRTVPDAASVDAVNPNADFLYSQAWLDLSKDPVILSVPDTKGRYYLIALLDAWTNVATSIGSRTTGSEKREFAIVGPQWKGTLPPEVTEVKSPTDLAWLFARVQVKGKSDRAAASKMQEQMKVTPLAQGRRVPRRAPPRLHPPGPALTRRPIRTSTLPKWTRPPFSRAWPRCSRAIRPQPKISRCSRKSRSSVSLPDSRSMRANRTPRRPQPSSRVCRLRATRLRRVPRARAARTSEMAG